MWPKRRSRATRRRSMFRLPHEAPLPDSGATQRTYGPPRRQGCFRLALNNLLQRIRSRGAFPGQDGDPRSLILIITAALRAVPCFRFSSCRSIVRPSSFHHSQTSATRRRHERRSGNLLMRRRFASRHHRPSRAPEPTDSTDSTSFRIGSYNWFVAAVFTAFTLIALVLLTTWTTYRMSMVRSSVQNSHSPSHLMKNLALVAVTRAKSSGRGGRKVC